VSGLLSCSILVGLLNIKSGGSIAFIDSGGCFRNNDGDSVLGVKIS
jgi:hypothetical protein